MLIPKLLKFDIILFIIIIICFLIAKKKAKKIKICLCTIGKLENNYIREFVEHYSKYKVDKIIIYDNNDINSESFDDVLSDYIKDKYVDILNFRGKIGKQMKMFSNCYKNNYKKYDWLIFYDIDEFINIKNFTNLKEFLGQPKFEKCNSIYLNWVIHTDNNLIYYDNRSLFERFPKIYNNNNFCRGKTIIRGNIEGIRMENSHILDKRIRRCDGFGNIYDTTSIKCKKPDFYYYYIDHFYSKSTEEFIKKIIKGDCGFGLNKKYRYPRIDYYFKFNKLTKKKLDFIINKTDIYITKLKKEYI